MNSALLTLTAFLLTPLAGLIAADSLTPYSAETVPDNIIDLWKDVDARKDALETEVVKEWREDGIVCRYVIFKIGTFKGADSRIAAFYTFPEGMKRGPAFVWAHGGGQRAEREHGTYFAEQGFATLDINWGGREIVEGIKPNTDWGKVDPSQGPQFYPGALRQQTKQNLLPDEHTIDPVVSPRNGNWYLLTYAARRAITFLEQQPEVDPEKIGFTGYSMGGNITSFVAIDPRLKAVVPMVGGASWVTQDFAGLPGSGQAQAYRDHAELFARTMESHSYYPHVKIPVLMLSASDDFHAAFDNVYSCMATLPHDNWRVSQKMHFNHNLGAQQWIMMNLWFDKYLKGEPVNIPQTAESELLIKKQENAAVFTVKPDQAGKLKALDLYFSHDPNPQSRFWKQVTTVERQGDAWIAKLELRPHLPLYVFANCTYPLDHERESFGGATSTFTLTSNEHTHFPAEWKLDTLADHARDETVFSTFQGDWGVSPGGGLVSYKFRDPDMKTPANDKALRLRLNGINERIGVRSRVTKNKYVTGVKAPVEDYSANVLTKPGDTEVVVGIADFKNSEKQAMTDWTNIATVSLDLIQHGKPLPLQGSPILQSLEWTFTKPGN